MHPMYAVFWMFFAAIVAAVGWSFVRMFLGADGDGRSSGIVTPPVNGTGPVPDTAGGADADVASGSMSGTELGDSVRAYDGGSAETAGSDSGGGDGGGGEGGGDSGGGGGGGW